MSPSRLRPVYALLVLCCTTPFAPAHQGPQKPPQFPFPEKLSYRVEWRLITAGEVTVQLSRANPANWDLNLDIHSAGLVTRLYRVLDKYKVTANQNFCGVDSNLDAEEGKRHRLSLMNFDVAAHKVEYEERDLLKNTTDKRALDVPACSYEIAGALASLRIRDMQPGKWATVPITDGKKLVYAKIQAQARESVTVGGKVYQTVRYEAFLFDDVLYRRKGRLFIWLSDDAAHIPVQFRFQLGFPIGTVTVELESRQTL